MRRAHRETRRPTRGRPRGGVCGNRKVLFQGHSEHPRTGETLQPVPPESQASQSSPRESHESLEKLSKASRDRSAPALRTGVLVRGVGAHPTKKGGLAPPSLLDPPLTGFSDTNGKAHSQTEHRRHTGNGERHHQLRSRHLGDKPGTLQEHLDAYKKQRVHTPDGKGMQRHRPHPPTLGTWSSETRPK